MNFWLSPNYPFTSMSTLQLKSNLSENSETWDTDSSVYTPSTSSADQNDSHKLSQLRYYYTPGAIEGLIYCLCCGPFHSVDDLIAEYQELSNFPTGDWTTQEHRDMRSAARARKRARKIRENKSSCNSYRCRRQRQTERRTTRKKKTAEDLKFALRESQSIEPCYTRSFFRRTKHHFLAWDTPHAEPTHSWVPETTDDIVRHLTLHRGAPVPEHHAPYLETGEFFAAWCQRRIAEMRAVKEDRLRRGAPSTRAPLVLRRVREWRFLKRFDVYTGDAGSTTLPTNAYDALGHELLRSILTPHRWWRKPQRVSNASLFRAVNGFRWFGEFEWEWYRNASGCWEIGYGGTCGGFGGDGDEALGDCACCCVDGGYAPAPDEVQRCCLVEWVGEESREIMMLEEENARAKLHSLDHDEAMSESGDAIHWEVISSASSEAWSVVDA